MQVLSQVVRRSVRLGKKECRCKRRWNWSLSALLLVLGVSLGAHSASSFPTLPGRKPHSTEPWGAFLGRAAHFAIGRQYRVQHPSNRIFLNTVGLYDIVERAKLGDPNLLPGFVRLLRPDITDADALVLFEVKPDNEEGLAQGRVQAGRYLAALNAVVEPRKQLLGGTGFEGDLFVEFENGGVLWQLSWRTPEPGVTLYRWSRRREKPSSSWKERAAQKEEVLTRKEGQQLGELAEQALRAAYAEGDWPHGFQGQVYLPVDCH